MRCAFACALAFAGCGSGDDMSDAAEQGVRTRVVAECDSEWRLASSFQLGLEVDYVADRFSADPDRVISEHGEPCATAQHRGDSEAALAMNTDLVNGTIDSLVLDTDC